MIEVLAFFVSFFLSLWAWPSACTSMAHSLSPLPLIDLSMHSVVFPPFVNFAVPGFGVEVMMLSPVM